VGDESLLLLLTGGLSTRLEEGQDVADEEELTLLFREAMDATDGEVVVVTVVGLLIIRLAFAPANC